jgi:hypothetical protein
MLPSASATTNTFSQQFQQKGPFGRASSSSSSSSSAERDNSQTVGPILASGPVTTNRVVPIQQKIAGVQFAWVHFLAGG